jgi:hypothetical protein
VVAARHSIEMHGVLWVLDQLHAKWFGIGFGDRERCARAHSGRYHAAARRELAAYINRYGSLK